MDKIIEDIEEISLEQIVLIKATVYDALYEKLQNKISCCQRELREIALFFKHAAVRISSKIS